MSEVPDSGKAADPPPEGHALVTVSSDPVFLSTGSTEGDQQVAYADVQIRVETAAHQRRVEQQRLEHELREEAKDNNWRRVRENVTFGVIVVVLVVVFVATVYVALTTEDPTRQTFAQALATTLVGAIGGAFAAYAVAERKH